MKVLMINHYATPPSLGSSGRHHALARELIVHGHEVLILASANHPFLDASYKASKPLKFLEEDQVKYLMLPASDYQGNGVGRLMNMLSFAWNAIITLRGKKLFVPDVVIGSTVHPFAALAGERIAAHYKVPFCFEVRDLWPQTLIDMKVLSKGHPLSKIFGFIERYLYRKAHKIISLLPYGYEYICNLNIDKEKIAYIPNGIDLDIFSDLHQSSAKNPQNFKVMYLGAHGPANDLETLLEAAYILEQEYPSQQVTWHLIGDGPQKDFLRQRVSELQLKSVFLEDKIPKSQVPRMIEQADALAFHLLQVDVFKYGISPNKLFDYLASLRPIIYACTARNNPVAEADSGISIAPENPRAMAEAVMQLAALPLAERNAMGQRGRTYVEAHHSYRSLGRKLNLLLGDLA
jgi:glycosyltransferase involved in cell wall biosynthesis